MRDVRKRFCVHGERALAAHDVLVNIDFKETHMVTEDRILIGAGEKKVYLLPGMANRHGLIAGATGTGKTVTLKVMAEGFSQLGVPVFLADVKGDVSTLAYPGTPGDKITDRLNRIGVSPEDFTFTDFPCRFWDVFGKGGIPVRATVTDLGPMLIARLLGISELQAGVLNLVFHVADDMGLELIDFKDLKAMLTYVAEHRKELVTTYGNVTPQSIGVIQRALLALEDQGGDIFFGEPALNIADWMIKASDGRGVINILHCTELINNPLMYATFMLWMLSELYENLPEVGDIDRPKLVFFFDEAHMLFKDAPKALLDKVTQVVKLVRSKGVGIYFITQSPSDIPDAVLSQLNNRVQHALRAYTPADQKAVRVAAQSFRANPAFKTEDAIANMGTGVALVSMLDETGAPSVVEQAVIAPPQSGFTVMPDDARAEFIQKDLLNRVYADTVDAPSAYEKIEYMKVQEEIEAEKLKQEKEEELARIQEEKEAEKLRKAREKEIEAARKQVARSVERTVTRTTRSVGREVGKTITRGVLGTRSNKRMGANSIADAVVTGLFKGLF